MQVLTNTTGMLAGMSFPVDKHAVEHCVLVVKGTFEADGAGNMVLAAQQSPLVMADEHYGDPETTPIRHECDFALYKPCGEVVVVGRAVAPGGVPVEELVVRLEVQGRRKDALVTGDRSWTLGVMGLAATRPSPFVEMPLTYDRAYGGMDDSRGPGQADVERRNLRGVGHSPHRSEEQLNGLPLPNILPLGGGVSGADGRLEPIGFGVLGRADVQRVRHAGTYDQKWIDDVFPFLPADFDDRYYMTTAEDQWFPFFKGGEVIRCQHMSTDPVVTYRVPELEVPIRFVFSDREVMVCPELDTIIVEPFARRAMLVWRASVPVGKKLTRLQGVKIGVLPPPQSLSGPIGYSNGKARFRSLGDAVQWLIKRKRS